MKKPKLTKIEEQIFSKIDEITKTTEFKEDWYRGDVTKYFIEYLLNNLNKDNRGLSKKRVNEYAQLMAQGQWHWKASIPIVIGKNGVILDGQHRLSAILEMIEDGQAVSILFIFTNFYDSPLNTPFDLNMVRKNYDVTGTPPEISRIVSNMGKYILGDSRIQPSQLSKLYPILSPAAEKCLNITDIKSPMALKVVISFFLSKNGGNEDLISTYKNYLLGGEDLNGPYKKFKEKMKNNHFSPDRQFIEYYMMFDPDKEFNAKDYTITTTTSIGTVTSFKNKILKRDITESLKEWYNNL